MTTVEEVVDTLLELGESDRRWIMVQLSPVQRSRLAAQLDQASPETQRASPAHTASSPHSTASSPATTPAQVPLSSVAPAPEVASDGDVERLSKAPAAQLGEILKREPAWIVHALLSGQPRGGSRDVLAHLPQSTRFELARLAHSGAILTPAVMQFLRHAAASRLQGGNGTQRASRFDRLVDAMRLRLGPARSLRRQS